MLRRTLYAKTLLLVARTFQNKIKQLLHGGDDSSKNLFDKLTRFNSLLGTPKVGFENKINPLLRNMDARRESEGGPLGEIKAKSVILFDKEI